MTGIRKEEIVEDKKELLCRIAGLLFQKGLVSGKDGNISIKTGEDEMLITPSGICKGFLTPDMIIRQRFDGTIIEGSLKSTREAGMHSRLYELRPDIGAVVHTHPAAATAFAVCGRKFPENWLLEVPALIGKIGIAGFAPAGSAELVAEVGRQRCHFPAESWRDYLWPGYIRSLFQDGCGGEYSQDNPVFADPGGCEGILKRVI